MGEIPSSYPIVTRLAASYQVLIYTESSPEMQTTREYKGEDSGLGRKFPFEILYLGCVKSSLFLDWLVACHLPLPKTRGIIGA